MPQQFDLLKASAVTQIQSDLEDTVEAHRILAETAANTSTAAAAQAQAFAVSAGAIIRADTTAGIAATTDGQFFYVPEFSGLRAYENDGGTAVAGPFVGQPVFPLRSTLVSALVAGYIPAAGTVVTAGGLHYEFAGGVDEPLDGLPGWVPFGKLSLDHFGAAGDLVWETVEAGDLPGSNSTTYGPRRLSGTNDIEAFEAMWAYATARGIRDVYAPGSYYVKSYTRQDATLGDDTFPAPVSAPVAEDIIVRIYDSSAGATAETTTTFVYHDRAEGREGSTHSGGFTVSGSNVVLAAGIAADAQVEVGKQFGPPEGVHLHLGGCLWSQFNMPFTGVGLNFSGTGLIAATDDAIVVGQFSYSGYKPGDNGQIGLVAGSGSGYYLPNDHAEIRDVKMNVPPVRAARVLGDAGNGITFQDSDPSILTGCFGYVVDADYGFDADKLPNTNVDSFIAHLRHWGCKYVAPGGEEDINKAIYEIDTKWVPQGGELDIRGTLKKSQGGYTKAFELAETLGVHVHDMNGDGIPIPYWTGVGDEGGDNLNATQAQARHQINAGGYFTFKNCDPVGDDSRDYGVYYKGSGESKNETYAGNSVLKKFNPPMSWICKGHWLEFVSGTPEGIRVRDVRSNDVDFGICTIKGAEKCVYGLHGNGGYKIQLEDGTEGAVHIERQRNVQLPETSTDMGDISGSGDAGQFKPGYNADNSAIYIEGALATTTTTAAATAGDIEVSVAAFGSGFDLPQPGDPVTFEWNDGSDQMAVSRITTMSADDAEVIFVEPLPMDVASGATVTVDQSASASGRATYKSSEHGLELGPYASADFDFTDVGYAGRHHARVGDTATNSRLTVRGLVPSQDMRRVPTTTGQAIYASSTTGIVRVVDADIPKTISGTSTTFLVGNELHLENCRVEDADQIVDTDVQAERIRATGCVKYNGSAYPGEITWTDGIIIGADDTGITYVSQSQYAYKDGDFIKIGFTAKLSSQGSNTGNVLLPLPVNGLASYKAVIPVEMDDVNFTGDRGPSAYVDEGTLRFTRQDGLTNASMTEGQLTDDTEIRFTGEYRWR